MLAAYALALAYAGGLWLHLLHDAEGATELDAPPPAIHWLRDSTLALPLVTLAVWMGSRLAERLVARYGAGTSRALVAAVLPVTLAFYASVAVGAGNPVHGVLFTAQHDGHELPPVVHVLRDSLVALTGNLLIAVLIAGAAAGRRHIVVRPRRLARAGVSLLMVVGATLGPLAPSAAPVAAATQPGSPCPIGAPFKHFDISAIDVKIPLNRFGDNDAFGKMYVLNQHIADVRAEEASQKVSIGLRDDPVQPLVIRANEGDCVEVAFTNNASGASFGVHIDGLAFQVGSSGDAVGANPASDVPRGASTLYRYWVPNDPNQEGAHHLHPGPGNRAATNHGLFGALVVEPPGSSYLKQKVSSADAIHPGVAPPLDSGWEAIIVPGNGQAAFRENVQLYHEIGNEGEDVFDKGGGGLPKVDPFTESYRPGARAMNYRSEPFMDRLNFAPEQESQAYGSYAFSDPATITPHSYLGDPMKFRILHAGSEVFHVFHLHGGGIRWRLNPKADPTFNYAQTGLNKHPVVYSDSNRTDSQAFGPGEAYNLEIEGGSGSVQQLAGEFLFHCHVVKHYVSGMWGFWRVFNTLQPDLAVLPDRAHDDLNGPMPVAVNSAGLLGKSFNGNPVLTAANLDQWVRPQIPPQGVRNAVEDSQVWNWTVDTSTGQPIYLGEPDDPNTSRYPDTLDGVPGHPFSLVTDRYLAGANSNRPEIQFDPTTGRIAFPLLRPHIGLRPPFSPNGHSGAPWLGETIGQPPMTTAVDPYANRPDALCPADSPVRHYNIVVIMLPVQLTSTGSTDPAGMIFSLAQDKAAFLSRSKPAEPLAIRGNIGDCIAVTLTSEQQDAIVFGGHAKVNLHIHHVQFDTQASDGVITGFSYEQSVRPYQAEDPRLVSDARVGDTSLRLTSVAKLHQGAFIGVGLGTEGIEVFRIATIDRANNIVTFDPGFNRGAISGGCQPTPNQLGPCPSPPPAGTVVHKAGEWAGVEFVQERWYPDVALDNIFWHDHVDGIHGWGHGAVGMLNIEPNGSVYKDPKTGALTDGAGTLTDIIVNQSLPNHSAAPGFIDTSFREWTFWLLDTNPLIDSMVNLRAEPFGQRGGDPSQRFSSTAFGDPFTPLPRAYPGDPVVIRTISIAPRPDTFALDGHRFFWENRYLQPGDRKPESSPIDAIHYGISEKFTLMLEGGAGGPQQRPGDYLYHNGLDTRFHDGAWGILRVLPAPVPDLQPLPDHPPAPGTTGSPCPATAPVHTFNVSALTLPNGQDGRHAAFVPLAIAPLVVSGRAPAEPLVLHVARGECVKVNLFNQLGTGSRVSFHLGLLPHDITSGGINVGNNPDSTVAPNASREYDFYADEERIEAAVLSDFGGDDAQRGGLYGSVVVAPPGATFTNPQSGSATDFGTQVDVHVPGVGGYRDFSLFFAELDDRIGQDIMPYPSDVGDAALINYQAVGNRVDFANPFSSITNGDPATPILRAYAGDPVRVHVIGAPGGEQTQVFGLGGLSWPLDPFIHQSEYKFSRGVGPYEKFDAHLIGGAGGPARAVGDFVYANRRLAYVEAGMWGLFRVLSDPTCPISPLDGLTCAGQPPMP